MLQSLKNLAHGLIALGAVAWYRYPAKSLTVIGVTGTDGKTTTSTIIYHILKYSGKKVALISTVAAYIGSDALDTGFHVTSPEPWALQKLIRSIKSQGYTHLVLEATSHGLDQHRLLGTNVQYAVVTNITHEHLDYHKTYARYLAAKAKLFKQAKVVAINQSDQSFEPLKRYIKPHTKVIVYNTKDIPLYPAVSVRFLEKYNQLNAIAAIKISLELEVPAENASASLNSFPGVAGRMQEIENTKGIRIIVDFAHTPNALENALTALKQATKGKLIAVYGAAGLRDQAKRPLMGEIGARLANEVVLTAEDPRTEKVEAIIRQIKQGITTNFGHVHTLADRGEAINFALTKLAKKGDTVAIFGKGHEQSLNLDGKTEIPWSDQECVKQILKR